jgi:acetylornithine/succinyldiaminopimelate/putrescine aminotransferase
MKAALDVYPTLGPVVASGRGADLRTEDGSKLVDFFGGIAVALLGQGHPRLLQAIQEQAERLTFQTCHVDLEVRRQACRRLVKLAPKGLDKVFLVNSGAEAVENALRLAFRATGRTKVLAFEMGFHGRTAGSAAATHHSEAWYGFPRTPYDVEFLPFGDLASLKSALDEDTAAVILEPVQGKAGGRPFPVEFLRQVRELTQKHGAWWIADEIQCGMGRTGKLFSVEHAGVTPDALTLAKGLAGGFPCGAVLVRGDVESFLSHGDLGTTFGGGPMACAAILVTLDVVTEPGFLDHVVIMGEKIEKTCQVGPVESIQGMGLLRGLRCSRPAKEVLPHLREQGILVGGSGDPHVIRLTPPLVIEDRHVKTLARALEKA